MLILSKIIYFLKVSRPGLWFATIWLYLLPTSQSEGLLQTFHFWYGLFYICFPLNFMVYGWNDMVDYETDQINPRKDTFWFGARSTKDQLRHLWKPILVVQLIFLPVIILGGGWRITLVILCFVIINGLYNHPTHGLRSRPPWELICQIGYLLVIPFSILLNQTSGVPWQAYLYLFFFSVQAHLMGEVMDIIPDQNAGRKTTATVCGMKKTKMLIIFLVMVEIVILLVAFKEIILSVFLGAGLIWLLIDLYLIFKTKTYNLQQMKFFAAASNASGFVTITYVWLSGCLLGG